MEVLHIGASDGEEIQFYYSLGARTLIYVEPDPTALLKLNKNIKSFYLEDDKERTKLGIRVIPHACGSESGNDVILNANGQGQSSILEVGSRTKEIVGDSFKQVRVKTITLNQIITSYCSSFLNSYLCIDTQGYEFEIMRNADPNLLAKHFPILDIEIMTDPSQYSVGRDQWKHLLFHVISLGYYPVVMPMGITESYLFINRRFFQVNRPWLVDIIKKCAHEILAEVFHLETALVKSIDTLPPQALAACCVDRGFLPLVNTTGVVHAETLDRFRKLFVAQYALIDKVCVS